MQLVETAIYLGLGFVFWAWSHRQPFRVLPGRPEYRWDLFAVAALTVFAAGATWVLEQGYNWAAPLPWLQAWMGWAEALPLWALILAYFVVADFGAYWTHRLLHTRLFWPAHAWHHSARVLYWLSGLRASPVHVLLLYAPSMLAVLLFPVPDVGYAALAVLTVHVANQHLVHSNIRLPWSRQIEWIWVTPRLHFIHHSATVARANSNYGFIFSVWDRWFGTFTDPDTVPAADPLGIERPPARWRMLLGLGG